MSQISRNTKGFLGFVGLAAIIGPLAEPIMIAREIYQHKKYKLPKFEWDDVLRYTIAILIGSGINFGIGYLMHNIL